MKYILPIFFLLLSVFSVFALEKSSILPKELISLINKDFPDFHIAQKSDFGSYLKKFSKYFNSVVEGDLNQDGSIDYTVLLINKRQRIFGFYTFINNGKSYTSYELSTSSWPKNHDGSIWQMMWLKKSGAPGMANEKYFNAPGKKYPYLSEYNETDINEFKAAVQKYINLNSIEKTDTSFGFFDEDDIFYCRSAHYFENNTLKSIAKCD